MISKCLQLAQPAVLLTAQADADIRQRGKIAAVLRPFDKTQAVAEQIVQSGIFPFFRRSEAVEVEMVDVGAVEAVAFHNRIGRTFYRPAVAEAAQQRTH